MEPTIDLTAPGADFLVIAAATAGFVQIIKDLGVEGKYLKLASFVVGGIFLYIMNFQPAWWDALKPLFAAGTATGGVSLADDLLKKLGAYQRGQRAA